MTAMTEPMLCPKGHISLEADYCSECGAKLQGYAEPRGGAAQAGQVCPDCGTVREQTDIAFCEVCGFNFVTGTHGEVGIMPAQPLSEPGPVAEMEDAPEAVVAGEPEVPVVTVPQLWRVVVSVDPGLRTPESPEPPPDVLPFTVELHQPVSLVGRRDETRGILPEVAIPFDEAVSRRHAVLQWDDQRGMLLRDIGAANGTRLNGVELEPMVDVVLKDGDEITLGHWSRLRVEAQ